MANANNRKALVTRVDHLTPPQNMNGKALPDLGNTGLHRRLTIQAEERAIGVLADPVALKQAAAAAPLLAVVNERCGDSDMCRLKYADVATQLGVSVTTLKTWAETLARLGYFTREPCGPAGVDIRLCPERWPSMGATALAATATRIADVLSAVRLTVDNALASAAADVLRAGEAA